MSAKTTTSQPFADLFSHGTSLPNLNYDSPSIGVSVGDIAKCDVSNCTFETDLVKAHRRVIVTRRTVAGLAYYAYFLLALQCTLSLLTTENTATQTIISSVILFLVTLFAATEIYTDTMTNYMSMTSILGEMVARIFSRGYKAINLFDDSWNKIRHRHLSESFRSSLSDDRDALFYLYATDNSADSYMKMTYAITSPVATSMWSALFPNVCRGFSVPFNGGVVQSIHTVSLGTSYTPISSLDFVIERDSLVSGVIKTVWRSINGSILKSHLSLLEMTANSIKDTKGNIKVSKSGIHVSCRRFENLTDMGVISFQSSDLDVRFNYDRTMGTLTLNQVKTPKNGEFETTAS